MVISDVCLGLYTHKPNKIQVSKVKWVREELPRREITSIDIHYKVEGTESKLRSRNAVKDVLQNSLLNTNRNLLISVGLVHLFINNSFCFAHEVFLILDCFNVLLYDILIKLIGQDL